MLINQFLLLGAVLFAIGVYGVLARKNAVLVLMSIELILNSVNINLLAFALQRSGRGRGGRQRLRALHHRRRRGRGRRGPGPGPAHLPQPSLDRARRAVRDEGLSGAMWFLENAWLIPVIPTVGYFVILLFGKRHAAQGRRDRLRDPGRVVRASPAAPSTSGSSGSTTTRPPGTRARSGTLASFGRSIIPAQARRAATRSRRSSPRSSASGRGGRSATSSSRSASRSTVCRSRSCSS